MRRSQENLLYFLFGFFSYSLIEILWRRYTHWTMSITGGICFVLLHGLFDRFRGLCVWKKCLMGGFSITGVEFTVGCIVNLWLKWNIWDYSTRPLNLFGQVCPLYTVLWSLLCIPIIALNRFLRIRLIAGTSSPRRGSGFLAIRPGGAGSGAHKRRHA